MLTARSRAVDLPWWQGFFNAVASGPPGFRVRELLALSRAGYIDFLGAGMWVEVADGRFRAGSATLAGAPPVTADVLVDARLPDPSAARTTDPLLAGLLAAGAVSEEVLVDERRPVLRNTGLIRVRPADGALIDATGTAHPRRFAVGPHTAVKVAGAFTRPGMNAQSLRYNDAIARAVLASLRPVRAGRRGVRAQPRERRGRRPSTRALSAGQRRRRVPVQGVRVIASWCATSAAISSACSSTCSVCRASARCLRTSSSSEVSRRSAMRRRVSSRVGADVTWIVPDMGLLTVSGRVGSAAPADTEHRRGGPDRGNAVG